MNKTIAVAIVAGCLGAAPAFAAESASRAETVGVGMGAVAGALAGGPVGFIVGAAIGATIGDAFHRKGEEVTALNGELDVARTRVAGLEQAVQNLNAGLESQRDEMQALRAGAAPDAAALLADGVSIDLPFRTDEDELAGETQGRLGELAATLASMPEIRLHLDGYADERGDAAYNQQLSERRARHVRDLLTARGVAADRITLVGHGESAATDQRADSYALERRVSMTLLLGEGDALAANPAPERP